MLHRNLLLLILIFPLVACHPDENKNTTGWDLTREQRDSLYFARTRHYSINYNFIITGDSLALNPIPPRQLISTFSETITPGMVYKGDKVVVADITYTENDSSRQRHWYIKIAHNQEVMGWVEEKLLRDNMVPCDPISQFIHTFSDTHIYLFCILIALALLFYIYRLKQHKHIPFIHFQDIDSIYPGLLCVTTALAATLYGSMQHFAPEIWQAYYFNPSLNPIGQPGILAAFLASVWMMLIAFIATLDEVNRQLRHMEMITYLLGLGCTWLIIYVVFSQSVKIYIGYPLFLAYLAFAWNQYRKHHLAPLVCGRCGRPLHHVGECPFCHAINK